ncbi:hypothetical protein AWZ03_000163 [Drosophila navojoa]|uniref:Secreted protein n=1 Tax=Drosophila navojoa TaxID=7232 RepID=A0A484BWZ4_DRONA|nr:hypothetical protein AWZ03_000163 [Drosophila navojoa]
MVMVKVEVVVVVVMVVVQVKLPAIQVQLPQSLCVGVCGFLPADGSSFDSTTGQPSCQDGSQIHVFGLLPHI